MTKPDSTIRHQEHAAQVAAHARELGRFLLPVRPDALLQPSLWTGFPQSPQPGPATPAALYAPFFALIYVKGYEKGKPGLGQGFRFGLYVGVMLCVMNSFGWYVLLPIPLALAFYWFLSILAEFIAAGVAAGLVYHD